MPGAGRKRGEPNHGENGADQGHARDKRANPAGSGISLNVFRKERRGSEGNQIEFEEKPAISPKLQARVELQNADESGQEREDSHGHGEPDVALAENVKLVGAILQPEGLIAKLDIVAFVVRNIPTRSENHEQSTGGQEEFPETGPAHPQEAISGCADEPQKADRMGEQSDGSKEAGDNDAISARRPDEGQSNASQTERQIVVHEAHVEDVTVGEHGDERGGQPGRIAGGRSGKGKNSPEENKNAEADSDFLGGEKAEDFGEIEEHEVEENVVPLPDDVDAGGSSLLNELCEPGVVDMAAKIAGFNVSVPEARNHEEKRDQEKDVEVVGKSGQAKLNGASLADVSVRCRSHFQIF